MTSVLYEWIFVRIIIVTQVKRKYKEYVYEDVSTGVLEKIKNI